MLLSSVLRGMRWIIEIAVFGVVAYFILLTAQDRIARSQQIGNWVTGECDAGSEADGLNSGMNYYKQGFLANAGLPDRGHPASGLYLNPDETPRFKSVYTHYPPGPNWIIGLSIYAFGPSQVPIYRMVPIVFSVICLFATYFMFRACWGAVIAGAAVVTLVHIPMTKEMMHGLFFHPYTYALLCVQVSYVFLKLKRQEAFGFMGGSFVFLTAFMQGWLSFDHAFLAFLYPLAVVAGWRSAQTRRMMLYATFLAAAGFTTAHILHLGQLWIYTGTFDGSIGELFRAARHRFNQPNSAEHLETRFDVVALYISQLIPRGSSAGSFMWPLPLTAAAVALIGPLLYRGEAPRSPRLSRTLQSFVALACAFCVSLAWIFIMKNHSSESGHYVFLTRHYIVFFLACFVVLGEELSIGLTSLGKNISANISK